MRQVATVQGSFWVFDQDQLGQVIESGAFWDQHLCPIMDEVAAARPNTWALDLGAGIGWFTWYLAQRFAYVYAVEAHPQTFQLLILNTRMAPNVQWFSYAAYDRETELTLAPGSTVGWPVPTDLNETPNASSVAFVATTAAEGISALGFPIDHCIEPGCPVSLIKVDVQGCELRALNGLSKTIRRCRPLILFEYEMGPSLWQGNIWQDYLDFFGAHRYDLEFLGLPKELAGHPGNYVARPT